MPTKIAVVGAGVIGLTTGIRLLENNFPTTIFARDIYHSLASRAAPAFWIPYRAFPEDRVIQWATRSLAIYQSLAPKVGVMKMRYVELHNTTTDYPLWTKIINEYTEIAAVQLPKRYLRGFATELYRVDSSLFVDYLLHEFQRLGGCLKQQALQTLNEIDVSFDSIVNCSGVDAATLVPDPESYPIRGQYLLVDKPADLNQITFAMVDENAYILIVPRVNDCYLGGTTTLFDWNTQIDAKLSQIIFDRACELEPALSQSTIKSVGVGLRPGRATVRLEKEKLDDSRYVFHNYGHGGAGFTVAWGCAEEVVSLIKGK